MRPQKPVEVLVGAWGLAVTWVFVTAIYAVSSWLLAREGDVFLCTGPGDSNYGTVSWSMLPPGPVCTWGAGASAESSGPSSPWVIIDLVLLAWLVVAVAASAMAVRATRGSC